MEEIMLNLYWKSENQIKNLLTKPFSYEEEFETYLFKNQEFLPELFILKRQVQTGSKQGILDMVGIDQNSRICLIEMKNKEVDVDILPQILGYAVWAETNPDSIRALWLESKNQPEDIQIDWDEMEIRCIVIAPSFNPTIINMAAKIGYKVDLIQVKRFSFENDEFILVEELEKPTRLGKNIATRGKEEWSWKIYEEEHGREAVVQFRRAVEAIYNLVKKLKWDITFNLNKYYTGFKYGNKIVFSVSWGGTHAWNIHLKKPESDMQEIKLKNWEFQRYDSTFNEVIIKPKQEKIESYDELLPLLMNSYNYVIGK